MNLLEHIVARAKSNKQRIVLPEATEERTLKAADRVLADELADLILIGNPDELKTLAAKWDLHNIDKATIVDPLNNPKAEEYAELLAELRKKKGMTIEQARELVKNPLYLGCMIIKTEGADGQISGALSTTGDTLRPALQIIKCAPGVTCVSGAMLMLTHEHQYGDDEEYACDGRRSRYTGSDSRAAGSDRCVHSADSALGSWHPGPTRSYAELLYKGLCKARGGRQGG